MKEKCLFIFVVAPKLDLGKTATECPVCPNLVQLEMNALLICNHGNETLPSHSRIPKEISSKSLEGP